MLPEPVKATLCISQAAQYSESAESKISCHESIGRQSLETNWLTRLDGFVELYNPRLIVGPQWFVDGSPGTGAIELYTGV